MKKSIILFLSAALLTAGCSIFANTPEEDAAKSEEVAALLECSEFTIDIDTILPSRGMPIHDTGYFLTLKDGKVSSYLPFIGRSDVPVMGSDKAGIEFSNCPVELKTKKNKDQTEISFKARSGNDDWNVTVLVWPSGKCSMTCRCSTRSIINYEGSVSALKEESTQ